ncbi:MAG: hypothetical protein QM796_10600 [Chthoniobacteraceae bacterium]
MKTGLIGFISRAWHREEKLHPLDQKMAKKWIKQRMLNVFPELRNNPIALEQAYHSLSLEPRPGTQAGDAGTCFEVQFPG